MAHYRISAWSGKSCGPIAISWRRRCGTRCTIRTQPAGPAISRGLALATFATESEHWSAEDYALLAGQLVKENPIHQPLLWPSSAAAGPRLVPELEKIFANQRTAGEPADRCSQLPWRSLPAMMRPRLARLLTTAQLPPSTRSYIRWCRVADGTAKSVLARLVAGQPADDLSETDRVALGQRRAGAAISLLALGEVEKSSRCVSNPGRPGIAHAVRASLPRSRRDRAANSCEVCARPRDVHSRFALLLALGDYPLAEIDPTQRDGLIKELIEAYGSDPSSAIHGATGWLLRKWGFAARSDPGGPHAAAVRRHGQSRMVCAGSVSQSAG